MVSSYNVVAIVGALLTIYVMQKTEHDRINKVAPPWLQWVRRASFIAMALLLFNSVLCDASQSSLVLLVWSGIGQLAINALALHLRVPPDNRSGRRIPIGNGFGRWEAWRRVLTSFRDSVHHK